MEQSDCNACGGVGRCQGWACLVCKGAGIKPLSREQQLELEADREYYERKPEDN